MAESSSAITFASLATLQPLAQELFPRFLAFCRFLASGISTPSVWGKARNQPSIEPTDAGTGKIPRNQPSPLRQCVLPKHSRHDSKFDHGYFTEQDLHYTSNKMGFVDRRRSSLLEYEPADPSDNLELGPYPYGHDTYSHGVSDEASFDVEPQILELSWGSIDSEEGIIQPTNSRTSLDNPRRGAV